jgi:anti-sigma factor RsiW
MPFMKHVFTPQDLIAYLYSEVSIARRLAIQDALRSDPVLAMELEELRISKQQFPQVRFTAPKRSLERVLRYSRTAALEEHV